MSFFLQNYSHFKIVHPDKYSISKKTFLLMEKGDFQFHYSTITEKITTCKRDIIGKKRDVEWYIGPTFYEILIEGKKMKKLITEEKEENSCFSMVKTKKIIFLLKNKYLFLRFGKL